MLPQFAPWAAHVVGLHVDPDDKTPTLSSQTVPARSPNSNFKYAVASVADAVNVNV
jgi:hypothetical protein